MSGDAAVHAVTWDSRPVDGTERTWSLAGRPAADPAVLGVAALRDGVLAALREGAAWVWVLGPGVVPHTDALGALLAAAGDAPVVAARVTGGAEVWPRVLDKPAAIAAAADGLVALRAAPAGAVLVRRGAIERCGPPRHGEPVLGWTARLLRGTPGLLVPAARAEQTGPAPRERTPWRALSPDEALWVAFRRAGRAGRSTARPRPAGTAPS